MEDYEFILNILKLSQDVISKLEFEGVIKEILKKGIEVLGVNHISLLIIEEGKSPPLAYEMYRGEKRLLKYHSTARLNKGISGMVIETKKPITINDLKNYPDANPVALKKGRRSVLAFPLTYKEKVIGIFYADSNEPNFFKESDLLKVQIFALNAGTALVNARIFEEIRYNQEKIKLLYRTSECLISSLNIKKVLKVLLKELKKSLNIKYSGVFYYDKKNNKLEIISWEGYRDKDMFNLKLEGESITLKAINTKRYHYAKDVTKDKFYVKMIDEIKSEISFPLIIGDDVIGAATFSKDFIDGFSEEEIDTLSTISNNLAISVHNYISFKEVEKFSITDPLTGVINRRRIEENIEKEIERSKRYSKMFGILFIDLDNFKEYNDRFGHLSGDEALKKLTAILKKNIRNIDTIGRYGGDEFIVLLVEAGVEKCENIAKRLIENIKDKMKNENITISVGVSIYPIHGLTKGKLIQAADSACFEAKREGGCRYKIWGQS